jgi:hypothetical protein
MPRLGTQCRLSANGLPCVQRLRRSFPTKGTHRTPTWPPISRPPTKRPNSGLDDRPVSDGPLIPGRIPCPFRPPVYITIDAVDGVKTLDDIRIIIVYVNRRPLISWKLAHWHYIRREGADVEISRSEESCLKKKGSMRNERRLPNGVLFFCASASSTAARCCCFILGGELFCCYVILTVPYDAHRTA